MTLNQRVQELTINFAETTKLKKKEKKEIERLAASKGFIQPTADRFYKEWTADHSIEIESWMQNALTEQLQYI